MSQTHIRKQARRSKHGIPIPQRPPWLWLLLICGGLLLVAGAAFAFIQLNSYSARNSYSATPIEVKGAPSLKVDREEVNLGDVKLGKVVDVSFQLTNVGDQTLRFSGAPYIEVREGC